MLHASTLGYEIATPTELPGVCPVHHKPHPNLPHGEEKKPKRCPYSNLLQGTERNHNPLKHSENEFPPLGEGWGGAYNQLFFYRQRRPFFTAAGRFLNHAGCCRHARHGVGGRRRRQGGKLVFRLPSPTATKRRSRQHPPWLFVFISTYYISR